VSPVPVPSDRRFHRAHVKPSRKRGRARLLLWPAAKVGIVTLLALIAIYRGGALVAQASMLKIDRVVVNGNTRMSAQGVLAALKGLEGENILSTDLDTWRTRLLSSPWVRDARLRRSLPSTIDVTIAEREPVGIGRVGAQLYLIDERGGLIDEYGPAYADFDLPIIDGLAPTRGSESPTDEARGELAARVLTALRAKPTIARRVSQIDVSDLHNAAVLVNDDPAVIYVGEDTFLPRLESYLGLADALRAKVPDIDYVDLRFDGRIYVRPAGAAATKAALAAGARRATDNRTTGTARPPQAVRAPSSARTPAAKTPPKSRTPAKPASARPTPSRRN
jgi:cell division protein FtsQ